MNRPPHARLGPPHRLAYNAAKGAVDSVVRTLAVEWAPQRIRVNAVAPGWVHTPAIARLIADGRLDPEHERDGHRRRATASAARSARLARGCGVAATPALNRAAPPSLTPREREVAALAAAGLPSPEIARQLVISVRTVETHLTNAFGKLGIHRRAELGTALHANPELSS